MCDSLVPSGEWGVPMTQVLFEGVSGKCPTAVSVPLALLLSIPTAVGSAAWTGSAALRTRFLQTSPSRWAAP